MDESYQTIIVGAGLSGLAVAHFLERLTSGPGPLLLEAGERPGGAVRSFAAEGYLAEWGPHGFLDNNPASRELLAATGLAHVALKAPLGRFRRFVCHQGRLQPLPQKPQALLTTPLLSLPGKLRLLGELAKKPLADGATIAEWAAHRFGREVLPLVDAAVTGTFAGDLERLTIDAVMPGVRRLEKEHGSVLRGLWREKKSNRGGVKRRLPAMTSFPQGMEQLTLTLCQGKNILFASPVTAIRRHAQGGWEISGERGRFRAPNLVLALPVNQALRLLADFAPPVSAIPEAKIATVALGFRREEAEIPAGFGYLAPEWEGRFALGAMFSSHMFPGRAPEGCFLLEALVGGRRHPERLELADEEIIRRVLADLGQLLPLQGSPVFARVLRATGGIPQLEGDHLRLLAWRRQLEAAAPGLLLSGFGWDGIGMNDMIQAARSTAERIVRGSGGEGGPAVVKPVYF